MQYNLCDLLLFVALVSASLAPTSTLSVTERIQEGMIR
jgi:hypothetical protein